VVSVVPDVNLIEIQVASEMKRMDTRNLCTLWE